MSVFSMQSSALGLKKKMFVLFFSLRTPDPLSHPWELQTPFSSLGTLDLSTYLRMDSLNLLKNFPQFVVIHTVKGFSVVNQAKVDVFLELSYFFYDTADVGNLISGSSAFSKSSLNTWKFLFHVIEA